MDIELIEQNKQEFIQLLDSIDRDGADIEGLKNFLLNSDFFVAPASAKYHGAYEGGLCSHCLNVFYNLMHLVKYKNDWLPDEAKDVTSITIVSLLHDISKVNLYEKTVRNKKVYDAMGNQKDSMGRYDWIPVEEYKKKDVNDTLIFGNHEMNSEYIARQYIPLTQQESVAILHHMGSMSYDSAKDDISAVFNRYPLALLLWEADCISTYIDEHVEE